MRHMCKWQPVAQAVERYATRMSITIPPAGMFFHRLRAYSRAVTTLCLALRIMSRFPEVDVPMSDNHPRLALKS